MTKEKMIEILMHDRCTKKEAEAFLKNGAVVIEESEISGFLKEYNEGAYDESDIATAENIEAGKVENFNHVILDGEKYYIMYVV